MTRALVAPILPPYRDPGGLLVAAMMGAADETVDLAITTDPVRFRHTDPSLANGVGDVLGHVPRCSRELTTPPETWESLTEFVAHVESAAPGDLTEVWASSSSLHSLAAAAALHRKVPAATMVVLVPTWQTDLPSLRGGPSHDQAADLWEVVDHADVLLSPAPAITRALTARWNEPGDRGRSVPEIRSVALGSPAGSDSVGRHDGSPALRILHIDDGTGPWALRELGSALELLPPEIAMRISVEVIGERPLETAIWKPGASPVAVSTTVVTDHVARHARRLASDLIYVAERSGPTPTPSLAWTWADGWDGRPMLATGPPDGVLRDLLGRAPIPLAHATALAYAVATAALSGASPSA